MRIFVGIILAILPLAAWTQPNEAAAVLDSILEAHIITDGKRPVPNFLLYTENGKTGFKYHSGAGIVGRTTEPVRENYQFKIASITKTFVSVVTLLLNEQGELALDDPVGKYIGHLDFLRFPEFHQINKTSYSDQITVEMLLRHQSGIGDIFTDRETRFNLSVLVHKQRVYSPERVVKRYFKYNLHKNAHFKPGEGYHYSDMNYMLLGFMIQEITGKTLAEAIRHYLLKPLQMQNTYFEYHESATGVDQQIDAYFQKINLTRKINTSYEWAGGGLISTTGDLAIFIQALFNEQVFSRSETLKTMINLEPNKAFNKNAGMGIFEYNLGERTYFGHGGFYGSLMLYDPENDVTFVANIGQALAPFNEIKLIEAILDIVVRT
jgi:D-alanyl-D-alanine carboxypeptidase